MANESLQPLERLGPLASQVMRALWVGETTVTGLADRLEAATKHRPAYTTLTTILSRLRARGLVTHRRDGRHAFFGAAVTQPELLRATSARAVDELVDYFGEPALIRFAERLHSVEPELRRRLIELARGHATDEADR